MRDMNKKEFINKFHEAHTIRVPLEPGGLICTGVLCGDCQVVGSCTTKVAIVEKEDIEWIVEEYPEYGI